MTDVVKEATNSEEGTSLCDSEMQDKGASSANRAPELYHELEVAKLMLRFSVGDVVQCNTGRGRAEGVVLQRFYREEVWPPGYYAAVRSGLEVASCPDHAAHSHTAAFAMLRSQYQVRLNECNSDGYDLIYAPLDEDRYIRRSSSVPEVTASALHVDGRLSKERRLIRKLEDSLCCYDDSKPCRRQLVLYDRVRTQHKKAMDCIIADLCHGLARSA